MRFPEKYDHLFPSKRTTKGVILHSTKPLPWRVLELNIFIYLSFNEQTFEKLWIIEKKEEIERNLKEKKELDVLIMDGRPLLTIYINDNFGEKKSIVNLNYTTFPWIVLEKLKTLPH